MFMNVIIQLHNVVYNNSGTLTNMLLLVRQETNNLPNF